MADFSWLIGILAPKFGLSKSLNNHLHIIIAFHNNRCTFLANHQIVFFFSQNTHLPMKFVEKLSPPTNQLELIFAITFLAAVKMWIRMWIWIPSATRSVLKWLYSERLSLKFDVLVVCSIYPCSQQNDWVIALHLIHTFALDENYLNRERKNDQFKLITIKIFRQLKKKVREINQMKTFMFQ